jgi:hypothetical protein
MAFTQSDLEAVESAIVTVASGGVAEIEDAFGNRTNYSDLDKLMKLKKIMEDDIARDARTSGVDLFKFAEKT